MVDHKQTKRRYHLMRTRRCLYDCTIVISLAIATSCNGSNREANQTHDTAPQVFAGYVVFGHEVRSFHACNAGRDIWVTDSSGILWDTYRALASPQVPYDRIFAILRATSRPTPAEGFGASYPGELLVDDVLYLANEGHDCDLDTTEFWARGSGNEPFWSFVVSQAGIAFASMEGDRSRWSNVRTTTNGDTTHLEVAGPMGIFIEITAQPCSDSMSGAYHGSTATVEYGGRTLLGCVIRGAGSLPPTG